MTASFLAESVKLAKLPAIWLIVAVWLALGLAFGYLFPYLSSRGTPAGPNPGAAVGEAALAGALPSALVPTAVQGTPMFAGALALLIGVLVTGAEYGWYTVKVLLAQGPGRLSVLSGKLVALSVLMLAIVLLGFGVDAVASLVVASLSDSPVDWPPFADLAAGVGAGWLVVGMWSLAGALLGILVRGTALAVGIGLVWVLAVENLLRVFASALDGVDVALRYLPATNAGSLVAALGQGGPARVPGVTDAVSGSHAVLVLGAYVVAFAVAAGILLRRRDVV